VGLPTAIGSMYAFYKWIVRRGRRGRRERGGEEESPNGVKSEETKNKSKRSTSRLQKNDGAQSQVPQPHGVPELGSDRSQQGQWQTPIELGTFRR
jgi:hypothetical protein